MSAPRLCWDGLLSWFVRCNPEGWHDGQEVQQSPCRPKIGPSHGILAWHTQAYTSWHAWQRTDVQHTSMAPEQLLEARHAVQAGSEATVAASAEDGAADAAEGEHADDEKASDKENGEPKERKGGPRRKVNRIQHPNRSNQGAAASEVCSWLSVDSAALNLKPRCAYCLNSISLPSERRSIWMHPAGLQLGTFLSPFAAAPCTFTLLRGFTSLEVPSVCCVRMPWQVGSSIILAAWPALQGIVCAAIQEGCMPIRIWNVLKIKSVICHASCVEVSVMCLDSLAFSRQINLVLGLQDFAAERHQRLASGGLWESVDLPPIKEVIHRPHLNPSQFMLGMCTLIHRLIVMVHTHHEASTHQTWLQEGKAKCVL